MFIRSDLGIRKNMAAPHSRMCNRRFLVNQSFSLVIVQSMIAGPQSHLQVPRPAVMMPSFLSAWGFATGRFVPLSTSTVPPWRRARSARGSGRDELAGWQKKAME